jgi:hypothetical protein
MYLCERAIRFRDGYHTVYSGIRFLCQGCLGASWAGGERIYQSSRSYALIGVIIVLRVSFTASSHLHGSFQAQSRDDGPSRNAPTPACLHPPRPQHAWNKQRRFAGSECNLADVLMSYMNMQSDVEMGVIPVKQVRFLRVQALPGDACAPWVREVRGYARARGPARARALIRVINCRYIASFAAS